LFTIKRLSLGNLPEFLKDYKRYRINKKIDHKDSGEIIETVLFPNYAKLETIYQKDLNLLRKLGTVES
jgi:hypothetical protein